ncbi:guanylate kinase [Geotoga petraea]|jgi:guanylate kinase|uniref:Guanylate kinase n=1 Tax=Geotoga petraea TaxID=28234 RepID=A0A1G6NLG4_9BACT|nr:guanylate kinase [Geotoga petraea]TGG87841.1 guanylate kinase [Geotoga petraea]SDC68116.1 guanylate kinase [Geotoga petraea]
MTGGVLYVVSGPSGAGKSTVIKKALDKVEGFTFSVSYTTREKRPGEIEGEDYFFISEEEFHELKEQGEFLEYAEVHGYYYGTSKSFIKEKLDEGFNIVLDVDVQGSLNIKKEMPYDSVLIFVVPPSYKELQKRLMGRGTENEKDLKKRLEDSKWEIQRMEEFDYLLENNDVPESVNRLISIIIAEQLKISRIKDGLEEKVDKFFKYDFS